MTLPKDDQLYFTICEYGNGYLQVMLCNGSHEIELKTEKENSPVYNPRCLDKG